MTNGVGQTVGSNSDQFSITTSNPNVLSLAPVSGESYQVNTNDATVLAIANPDGSITMPTITGDLAGSATITVTDLSMVFRSRDGSTPNVGASKLSTLG